MSVRHNLKLIDAGTRYKSEEVGSQKAAKFFVSNLPNYLAV